jgi:hypothetical protein
MKRTLLSLAAVALLFLLAGCDTTSPEPDPTEGYVPLAGGNEWNYVWDLPEEGDPMDWEVLGPENGSWSVEFTWGGTTEQWLWRHTADGEFQARPAGEENWRTYLKTPIEVDNTWTFSDDEGVVWEGRIGDTDMEFDTPSGFFDELVWVVVKRAEEEHDWEWSENYWFKEGVGIVRVAIDDDDSEDDEGGYASNWRWVLNYYRLR